MSDPPRVFVSPLALRAPKAKLGRDAARYLGAVLRLAAGDRVLLLDGAGWMASAAIESITRDEVVACPDAPVLASGEPRVRVTLAFGLTKSDKAEFVVQKATELGVAAFWPLVTTRTVVHLDTGAARAKVARWQRIAREAAEQCERARIPRVEPPRTWEAFWDDPPPADQRVLLEGRGEFPRLRQILSTPLQSVALLVGPEGGWDPAELKEARSRGASIASLGPRILRAETAAIVAAALVLDE